MLTLHLIDEQVKVQTIVEAREAAIIYINEVGDPALLEYDFRLCNQERVIGVVTGGLFHQAH
jgi:hypothetical protein